MSNFVNGKTLTGVSTEFYPRTNPVYFIFPSPNVVVVSCIPAFVQNALIKKNNWKTIPMINKVNPIPESPASFKYDKTNPNPKYKI